MSAKHPTAGRRPALRWLHWVGADRKTNTQLRAQIARQQRVSARFCYMRLLVKTAHFQFIISLQPFNSSAVLYSGFHQNVLRIHENTDLVADFMQLLTIRKLAQTQS